MKVTDTYLTVTRRRPGKRERAGRQHVDRIGTENRRTHMIKWAGIIITLCGVGHTLGSLVETTPSHADAWFGGALWGAENPNEMSHATSAFWYSVYSFGPLLIVVGLTVLWLGSRGITPPSLLAWAVAAWTVVGAAFSGVSPLLLLLIASGLLLAGARRAKHRDKSLSPADTSTVESDVADPDTLRRSTGRASI
jgi:Family of unknown function (DUF6463)